jgi:site-specific recombinase XerD
MGSKRMTPTCNALTPYVERYLNGVRTSNHSVNTLEAYSRVLHSMATVMCLAYDIKDIQDVKGFMLEDFVDSLGDVSAGTQNYYVSIVKQFFIYTQEAGYLERNPSTVLKKARVIVSDEQEAKSLDDKAYTDKELLSIMKHCDGQFALRDKAIIAMLSGTGMRASELCSLTIDDWRRRQNGHIYVKRKGGAYRWVAVATYVDSYIKRYLEERPDADDESPLFITATNRQVARQSLYKILGSRQDAAGVAKGVHIFRHTFLTGTSKTSNIKIAQSLANHSSEATTQRYIHTTSDERRSAVNSTAWAGAMSEST